MNVVWKIKTLERRASDDYVKAAHWTATGIDGGYSTSVYSTCGLPDGTPTIPFASLTETTVLGWVWANGVDKTAIESSLASKIDDLKNPPILIGVPWGAS